VTFEGSKNDILDFLKYLFIGFSLRLLKAEVDDREQAEVGCQKVCLSCDFQRLQLGFPALPFTSTKENVVLAHDLGQLVAILIHFNFEERGEHAQDHGLPPTPWEWCQQCLCFASEQKVVDQHRFVNEQTAFHDQFLKVGNTNSRLFELRRFWFRTGAVEAVGGANWGGPVEVGGGADCGGPVEAAGSTNWGEPVEAAGGADWGNHQLLNESPHSIFNVIIILIG
jgi:hypothetical protein